MLANSLRPSRCYLSKLHERQIEQVFKYSRIALSQKIEPVNLAYASYESTKSTAKDEIQPPLLVFHGLFGSKANWNSICKVIHQKTTPQRKVVAVDVRNHGDSPHTNMHSYEHMAEDIKALYNQLNIKKAALLGHSMGGRAVMLFALKYPELVDKLIVADVSPVTTSPNMKSMPVLFHALQQIKLPKNVPLSAARMTAEAQLAKNVNDKGLRAFLLTNLVQTADGGYSWRINISVLAANFEKHIALFPAVKDATFNGPIIFIGGGTSDFIQTSDHPQILKIFPTAEFKYIEGAGHWVHSEKPAEFLQICIEFLNRQVMIS